MLLVDAEATPEVTLRWTTSDGEERRLAGVRAYGTDNDRTDLGGNISCYVAVGGTRLSKGAGHPRGAIVRVGFYKLENAKPFFDGITRGSRFTVELNGVRFNQPVAPQLDTLVQHLKYAAEDLEACELPGDAREQFNLVSRVDTMNGRTQPGIDTRMGGLDGGDDSFGEAEVRVAEDDAAEVSMSLTFSYPALRNIRDPWRSDLPGTFLEPYHFHVEFEVLPEGVEPIDVVTPEERLEIIRQREAEARLFDPTDPDAEPAVEPVGPAGSP